MNVIDETEATSVTRTVSYRIEYGQTMIGDIQAIAPDERGMVFHLGIPEDYQATYPVTIDDGVNPPVTLHSTLTYQLRRYHRSVSDDGYCKWEARGWLNLATVPVPDYSYPKPSRERINHEDHILEVMRALILRDADQFPIPLEALNRVHDKSVRDRLTNLDRERAKVERTLIEPADVAEVDE